MFLGAARFKKSYSKAAKDWVVKNIYEKKTTNYALRLVELTIASKQDQSAQTDNDEEPRRKMPRNIAPTPAPPLQDLIAKKRHQT